MPTELNDSNFDAEVKKADKSVVDFWAEWCGPCKMLGPRFEELSKEMKDVSFFKVNVDEAEETAASHEIMSIPTLIIFKKGVQVGKVIGAMSKDALKEKILHALK
ncbi:MAG: thioredoxin [Nanoarchaeota archaeon]|nr:thioredoxin [Nanoarchaeota archaeon]